MTDYVTKHIFGFIALVIFSFFPIASFADNYSFDKIVFLGDSLSDDGNLYHMTFGDAPASPPYFDGRFSNGPVWSEEVAAYFSNLKITSSNYAVGGETAVFKDHIFKFVPYSLASSTDDYIFHTLFHNRSKTLVVIWIGANDYLYDSYDVGDRTDQVIAQVQYEINKLVDHGVKDFLLVNLPDLSKSPYAADTGTVDILSQATAAHNAKLAALVAQEQANVKGVTINLFDVGQLFNTLIATPDVYNKKYNLNISDVSDACYDGSYTKPHKDISALSIANQMHERIKKLDTNHFDVDGYASFVASSADLTEAYRVAQSAQDGVVPCASPDTYVFWDHLHPTAVVHTILANEILAFINQTYGSTK